MGKDTWRSCSAAPGLGIYATWTDGSIWLHVSGSKPEDLMWVICSSASTSNTAGANVTSPHCSPAGSSSSSSPTVSISDAEECCAASKLRFRAARPGSSIGLHDSANKSQDSEQPRRIPFRIGVGAARARAHGRLGLFPRSCEPKELSRQIVFNQDQFHHTTDAKQALRSRTFTWLGHAKDSWKRERGFATFHGACLQAHTFTEASLGNASCCCDCLGKPFSCCTGSAHVSDFRRNARFPSHCSQTRFM
mmetsp:Transcript_104468/g.185826  ORF Transcript_104468/g.185826 Transcript_104468/m.185826 type:complete len:249 (-) Transcript_104468:845-1591(-)